MTRTASHFRVVELELTGPKLRTASHFSVVEFAIAEIASTSRNVRRTFHVPSVVPVQWSISESDVSHPYFSINAWLAVMIANL